MSDFTRYIVPNGGGVTHHPSGRLYMREDVDPVVDALRARIRELEVERDAWRNAYQALADITTSGGIRHSTDDQDRRLQAARKAIRALIKKGHTDE